MPKITLNLVRSVRKFDQSESITSVGTKQCPAVMIHLKTKHEFRVDWSDGFKVKVQKI